jgi:esterase/lipase superfamily enzyme
MALLDFVICARDVRNGKFGNEPAESSYLFVPDGELPSPTQKKTQSAWVKRVIAESRRSAPKNTFTHLLVFVHGFNNTQASVMRSHRRLRDGLAQRGWNGVVVSFDWPSGNSTLGYLEDRVDAKRTAMQLVSDGVVVLADLQEPDCPISVHLLAHSMGAFVTREAFDDADDRGRLTGRSWLVSQVMFMGGDVSAGSMSEINATSESLYRHTIRLTNYNNRADTALALSNVKRVGVAPRVGRHGLPEGAPSKAVNVDCTDHWLSISRQPNAPAALKDSHGWYLEDEAFLDDICFTMLGEDREVMPTRVSTMLDNRFLLRAQPT